MFRPRVDSSFTISGVYGASQCAKIPPVRLDGVFTEAAVRGNAHTGCVYFSLGAACNKIVVLSMTVADSGFPRGWYPNLLCGKMFAGTAWK